MRKTWLIWILIGLFAIFVAGMALAEKKEEKTEATKETKVVEKAEAPVYKYMGATKCKPCHNIPTKTGKQFDIWSEGPHAGAYATLANEKSQEIAKKMKIEDAQKAGECLVCHITGYGVPDSLKSEKYTLEEGVSCEACHGAGEKYYPMKIMKDKKLAMENGLIEPTEELCVSCHNEKSPTFIGFKYDEFVKKIDHSYPEKKSE